MHPQQPYDPYQPQPLSPAPQQQPYQQQQPYPPQVHVVPAVNPTSGAAVVSLIAGILGIAGGWCCFGLPCLAAIIAGHVAQRETRTGQRGGNGLAVAGLVLGYIGIIPAALITIFWTVGMVASVGDPATTP